MARVQQIELKYILVRVPEGKNITRPTSLALSIYRGKCCKRAEKKCNVCQRLQKTEPVQGFEALEHNGRLD